MRIVVGLSGGVDSSVAAYLLQKQGHEIIGIFMKNWDETTGSLSGDCPWKQDRLDALKVASQLGIRCYTVDFTKEYRKEVVDYMFQEYAKGNTPNPDVLCNREIKFKHFFKEATKFDADMIATGHYARKSGNRLLMGKDKDKDQSYFLCQLSLEQLQKALFPVGELTKTHVRSIAKEQGFITADKKDSQGICFVGKVDLPVFLKQKLKGKQGDIIDVDTGKVVGQHDGAHFFTIGQRKGLDVGGTAKPLFVVQTDVQTNIVSVCEGENHPRLFQKHLRIREEDFHISSQTLSKQEIITGIFYIRLRHRHTPAKAELCFDKGYYHIEFDEAQRAVTPGQFAALYDGEVLVASGVISQ